MRKEGPRSSHCDGKRRPQQSKLRASKGEIRNNRTEQCCVECCRRETKDPKYEFIPHSLTQQLFKGLAVLRLKINLIVLWTECLCCFKIHIGV